MTLLELIATKRDGQEIMPEGWDALLSAMVGGNLPSYQHAALNIAVAIQGLTDAERACLLGAQIVAAVPAEKLELSEIGIESPLWGGLPPSGTSIAHELIGAKINGNALPAQDIEAFIRGVVNRSVTDAQIAAFCMAVFLKGMSRPETVALTRAMAFVGDRLDWGKLPTVDKHSTGGIGDKVSLPLAAVLAACGAYVPMISGRGLGHTGGTLDKLESIPGYRISLSNDEILNTVKTVGASIVGQTATLAPADRRLYAIRDVTATVNSIPLITASILSKKLAEGTKTLLLDVKVGSGAFMKNHQDARALAESLVQVGTGAGLKMRAILTDMSQPLGTHCGNALEVEESLACLRGEGPPDLTTLVVKFAAVLLTASGICKTEPEAVRRVQDAIASGAALRKFDEMATVQGAAIHLSDTTSILPKARLHHDIKAKYSGYLHAVNTETLGWAIVALGGGRRKQDDVLDLAVGLIMKKRSGDRVIEGDTLLELHANETERLYEAVAILSDTFRIEKDPPLDQPLIIESL